MPSKIISVVNRKGGVGKTTLAIGIADTLISRGKRVCFFDLDPQATASRTLLRDQEFFRRLQSNENLYGFLKSKFTRTWLNKKEKHYRGMCHFIIDKADIDLRLYPNSELFWDLEEEEIRRDSGKRFRREIKRLIEEESEHEGFVIVDCPPGQSASSQAAMEASNLIICPITPDRFSLWGKESLDKYIENHCQRVPHRWVITRKKDIGGEAQKIMDVLKQHHDNMLRVVYRLDETSGTPASGELACLSENVAAVRQRIDWKVPKPLLAIYEPKGETELVQIVDAIEQELGKNG